MTVPPNDALLVVEVVLDDDADVDEFHRWYAEEHAPEKLAMAGVRSLKRYQTADGGRRFLAVYQLDEPTSADAASDYQPSERMRRVMAGWAQWERSTWVSLE